MSDDRSTFETTRARLEDIVTQVRRKDVSLEQSLDMLEEAVRLVNQCNELIDQTSFKAPVPESAVAPVEAAEVPVFQVETVEIVDTGDGDVAVLDIVETFEVPDDAAEVLADVAEGDAEDVVPDEDADAGAAWGSVDAWDEDVTAPVAELDDDARE